MKYDYTPQAAYLTLESPASQHPPFWPLMGAILARFLGSQDTFLMLKLLALVFGSCLWLTVLIRREDFLEPPKLLLFGLIAISPWLVDFSTNASPYILIAFLLMLAEWLWRADVFVNRLRLSGVGAFCGLSILILPTPT